jgi:hypothetical protein
MRPGYTNTGWIEKQPALIAELWTAYQAGGSLASLARQCGRDKTAIRDAFLRRGYKLRDAYRLHRQLRPYRTGSGPNGQYLPAPPVADEVVERLIMEATRICIPEEMRLDWRKWPLAKRGEFIRRIRERLPAPEPLPTGPLSTNVMAWHYGTQAAWDIVNKANAGMSSQQAPLKIKLCSRGLIWLTDPAGPSLWFWVANTGFVRGPFLKRFGRPILHRSIYASVHGPLPESGVVRHIDGNWNNVDPSNLLLMTRDDLARENQGKTLLERSRAKTALLLKVTNNKQCDHELITKI